MTKRERLIAGTEAARLEVQNIFEAIGDAFVVLDTNWRYTYVNEKAAQLFGRKREELIGKHIWTEFPEWIGRPFYKAYHKAAEIQQPVYLEEYYPPHNRWFENRIYPTKDGILILFLDITERKRAEEALRESEAHYRSLLENMLDGFAYCRMLFEDNRPQDFIYLDVNRAFEELTGLRNVVGKKVTEVIPGIREFYPQLFEIYGRVALTGQSERFELYLEPLAAWLAISVYSTEKGCFVATFDNITGRKQAEEKIRRQLEHLAALRAIDMAIISVLDLRVALNVLLEHVITQLGVHAADVLLLEPHMQALTFQTGRGFLTTALQYTQLQLGKSYAGRAALERHTVHISNLAEAGDSFAPSPLFHGEGFVTYFGVPLIAKGKVKGVLEIFHRAPLNPDQEWFDFMGALAGQAAIAIDNAELFNDLQRSNVELTLAYNATIEGWSRALDLRDKETEGHTLRVTEITLRLAQSMNLGDEALAHIRWGSLLHDTGKMGIPDAILLKPGSLTDEEQVVMRKHPQYAYDMLAPITFLHSALDIPYCHHEKWDGTGYPRGLKSEAIPLAARIFAVVDVWDALRSDRPYRPAWTEAKVREHIRGLAWTHFDPKVVEVFLKVISETADTGGT